MDPRSVRITDDRLCSLFRRNFFATRADSPPVEADPATNSVMVAIHAGHITFLLLLRSHLSFSYPILFHFNHTTKEPSRFRTAISTLFARAVRRSPFGVRRSAAAQSQAMVQVQDIGNTLKAKSWRKGRYTIRQSPGSRRTIFRAGVLLRRGVPVPGILATHRPGVLMDKSARHFVARYSFRG
jgi:hypothetical protein